MLPARGDRGDAGEPSGNRALVELVRIGDRVEDAGRAPASNGAIGLERDAVVRTASDGLDHAESSGNVRLAVGVAAPAENGAARVERDGVIVTTSDAGGVGECGRNRGALVRRVVAPKPNAAALRKRRARDRRCDQRGGKNDKAAARGERGVRLVGSHGTNIHLGLLSTGRFSDIGSVDRSQFF